MKHDSKSIHGYDKETQSDIPRDQACMPPAGGGPRQTGDLPNPSALGSTLGTLRGKWFRLILQFEEQADLGSFSGSAIRGGFGHALRRLVCSHLDRSCDHCDQATSCSLPRLFNARPATPGAHGLRNGPRPQTLVLRIGLASDTGQDAPSARGQRLPWGNGRIARGAKVYLDLLLLEESILDIELCLRAIRNLGRFGIGVRGHGRGMGARFRMISTWILEPDPEGSLTAAVPLIPLTRDRIFEAFRAGETSSSLLPEYVTGTGPSLAGLGRVRLSMPNGIHLKHQGRLEKRPTFRDLVSSTLRRWGRLAPLPSEAPPDRQSALDVRQILAAAEGVETYGQELERVRLDRFSTRQRRRHAMEAMRGTWELGESARAFVPILLMAERLGVGKGSTFGLGELRMERSHG